MENDKVLKLFNKGLKVDEFGRLSDWKGWPPPYARPQVYMPKQDLTRDQFTKSELDLLRSWFEAGRRENFTTSMLFEQLEVLVLNEASNSIPYTNPANRT